MSLRIRIAAFLLTSLCVFGAVPRQAGAQMRIYVMRTGDPASDTQIAAALQERGHSVSLGVMATSFDGVGIRLSDFHSVVILGSTTWTLRGIPATGLAAISTYLRNGGGVVVDGSARVGELRGDRTLSLPADFCNSAMAQATTFTRVDPPDPLVHDGVAESFPLGLTTTIHGAGQFNEVCLFAANGGRMFFQSVAPGEARSRAGMLGNENGSGRSVVLSASARPRELGDGNFRRLFANAVEWAGERANPTEPDIATRATDPLRIFVLRTGDVASDNLVAKSLRDRGHAVSMGVLGTAFDGVGVRLSDFHAVVALGSAEWNLRGIPAAGSAALRDYVQKSGALIVDGPMRGSELRADRNLGPLLPGELCNGPGAFSTTRLLRVDPVNSVLHSSLPSEFDVNVTLARAGSSSFREVCLYEVNGGRSFYYSMAAGELRPRPSVIGAELSPASRSVVFSVPIRERELTNSEFSNLFVNAVEWAASQSEASTPPAAGAPSASPLKVYVFRSGETASDNELVASLRERGHTPSLGVLATSFDGTGIQLSDFRVVVAPGSVEWNLRGMPAAGSVALRNFAERSGGLVVDGPLIANEVRADRNILPLLPSSTCNNPGDHQTTTFQRVDPFDGVIHNSIPESFQVPIGLVRAGASTFREVCLFEANGGRSFIYSIAAGEARPRPAVLGAIISPSSRSVAFSVPFRQRELQTREFRQLFVNAVEWAAGVTPGAAAPTLSANPSSLTFNGSGSQTIELTSTGASIAFTAAASTTSGGNWLQVSPQSGTTPTRLNVSANAGTLAPGNYGGQIAISAAGATQNILVTLSVSGSGSSLLVIVGPSPLMFRFSDGATQAQESAVSIYASTDVSFSVTKGPEPWLAVRPTSGSTPGGVLVTVNPTGLAAGTYRSSLVFRVPSAPERTVDITIIIDPSGPPKLVVEPSSLNLSGYAGGEAKTGQILVQNQGRGNLEIRATASGGSWLSVRPATGTATIASPVSLLVTADPSGLQPGSYPGRITVSTNTGETAETAVVFSVSEARQSMLLSQTAVSFTAVSGGGSAPPQSFAVVNTGEGVMDWSAAASTLAGGSWLSVSPARGSSNAASLEFPPVDINVDAAGLAPGEYHGRILVSSPLATNSPQVLSVLLRVLPPGSDPGPVVRPTGLIFTSVVGSSSSATQEVRVSNLTSSQRSFVSNRLTSDGQLWFTHLPERAGVPPSQPARILVQGDLASLTPGVRRGVLTLLFPEDGTAQTVSVLSIVAQAGTKAAAGSPRRAAICPSRNLVLTWTSLRQGFAARIGQGLSVEVKGADECGNPLTPGAAGTGAVLSATFSNGDAPLKLTHIGGGVWSGTWRPVRPSSSGVNITVTAFYQEGTVVQSGQISLAGAIQEVGRTPIVTAAGLQHGATYVSGIPIAPGTLFTVSGSNLTDGEATPTGLPLPRELNGVEVIIGNRSVPLLYVSDKQVNVQVPLDLPPNTQHQILVRRGIELSVPETIAVASAAPGIFTKNQRGTGQGVILKSEGATLAEPGTAARAGERIVVYCTGLGAVTPAVESGAAAPGDQPARVVASVELTIGDKRAEVISANLTPGGVGVYEVTAVVPDGVTGDAVVVTVGASGQVSPAVTMAIE